MRKMEEMNYYEVISRFSNEIKVMIYTAFVFLKIDTDTVTILLVLMLFDTVFGMAKAIKMKVTITINKLLSGVTAKSLFLMIPMTVALMGKGLGYNLDILVQTVLKVLIVGEGISIMGSMYVIKTGNSVEHVDVVSMLLGSIRKRMLSILKLLLGDIEKPKT